MVVLLTGGPDQGQGHWAESFAKLGGLARNPGLVASTREG
jgi:hypothetical protein